MNYKQHTNCRVCASPKLTPYLDLGMMPLSNQLMYSATEEPERFPLVVALCEHCGLSQLTIVIPPKKMFSHYVYRSGISQGYKDHCKQMAKDINLAEGAFHIDIAGNDGTLLEMFDESENKSWTQHKYFQLNVDPAENLFSINESKHIRQLTRFWNVETAAMIQKVYDRQADLITATNVFAHCDNVREFLLAVKMVLAADGKLVLEFPYLIDFIQNKEFDTVYFEHLSYFSITPLVKICNDLGLIVLDVTHHEIHGGSVRVIIGKKGCPHPNVNKYLTQEYQFGLTDIKVYRDWADEVQATIQRFRQLICGLNDRYKFIAGFAASAKGNTLLNAAGAYKELVYIIDETPEKQGKFSPGTGIEIVPLYKILVKDLDFIVILSWNFADEIKAKCRAAGFKGRFILPLTSEIID